MVKKDDSMKKLVSYIKEKTGTDEKTIKRILEAEREYFLKKIME